MISQWAFIEPKLYMISIRQLMTWQRRSVSLVFRQCWQYCFEEQNPRALEMEAAFRENYLAMLRRKHQVFGTNQP